MSQKYSPIDDNALQPLYKKQSDLQNADDEVWMS